MKTPPAPLRVLEACTSAMHFGRDRSYFVMSVMHIYLYICIMDVTGSYFVTSVMHYGRDRILFCL